MSDASQGRQRADRTPTDSNQPEGSPAFLRRFFRLAAPYFTSEEKWRAWTMLIGVLALTSLQIAIAVRLNVWNRDFFNALEAHDWNAFMYQMGLFGLLAAATMGVAVYQVYVKQLLMMHWRRWLTAQLVDRWLENGRHYHLNLIDTGVDNPDQRISENTKHTTEMAVEFGLGIFDKTITLLSFIGILWTVSGALDVAIGDMSFKIPGYMVFAALLYAGIGSALTYLVGRPIVGANMRQTATEADYRFALVRLRENSEAVALIRGEPDEKKVLTTYFGDVLASTIGLMRTQRRLMWLTSFYAAVGMVYPTLVASPRFFAGAITLGVLMQITAAFGQVQTSLNYFVDNFPKIAEWRSHVERLLEFDEALETAHESESESGDVTTIALAGKEDAGGAEGLRFDDLQITTVEGNIVIADANTEIAKGERVLIVGPSGSGKSTLFRAIAGLWPWGAGRIVLPDSSRMMFMPQRPYLPLGTLREAVVYPAAAGKFSDAEVGEALKRCGLEHLLDRLDDNERWDRVLSGGEQQRLAFTRLLLHKPEWVFMDEATSALDEEGQESLMRLFTEELAGTTIVSIAHRPGMDAFHDRTLTIETSTGGARLVTKRRRSPLREAPVPREAPMQREARRLADIMMRRLRSAR
jgi:vitamin B12/bleomycin/antimicrobial peptide transport system ATP-binding/permease protein